jgi:hypothetical protein
MKALVAAVLVIVSINAFAWTHTGSSFNSNTSHSYNGHRRF